MAWAAPTRLIAPCYQIRAIRATFATVSWRCRALKDGSSRAIQVPGTLKTEALARPRCRALHDDEPRLIQVPGTLKTEALARSRCRALRKCPAPKDGRSCAARMHASAAERSQIPCQFNRQIVLSESVRRHEVAVLRSCLKVRLDECPIDKLAVAQAKPFGIIGEGPLLEL